MAAAILKQSGKVIKNGLKALKLKEYARYQLARHNTHQVCNIEESKAFDQVITSTEVSTQHLTPELSLHLITPNCALWKSSEEKSPFKDPFWAFYWPGGQALARYILDNPYLVKGLKVLDIGSGSGAVAIAASKAGAKEVTANDTDVVSIAAIKLNSELNNVTNMKYNTSNLIGQDISSQWDCILFGDMLYEETMIVNICEWLKSVKCELVLVGDPGRHGWPSSHKTDGLGVYCIAKYELPDVVKRENHGFTNGFVWKIEVLKDLKGSQ